MTVVEGTDPDPLPLVPARIVNEYVYCARLAYLEWVDHRFTDNADTEEGRYVHRRVDRVRGRPPAIEDVEEKPESTSVTLASDRLGLVGKIDLLATEGRAVVPVEYKRGRPREGRTCSGRRSSCSSPSRYCCCATRVTKPAALRSGSQRHGHATRWPSMKTYWTRPRSSPAKYVSSPGGTLPQRRSSTRPSVRAVRSWVCASRTRSTCFRGEPLRGLGAFAWAIPLPVRSTRPHPAPA